MEIPSYFQDFLASIRPTTDEVDEYKKGHSTLTNRLYEDDTLKKIIISNFLQGSYRRATAVTASAGKRADVDVVVVTSLPEEKYSPQEAMDVFVPFLNKFYKDKYEFNSRSIKIALNYVEMDLVVTSAPSESQEDILESNSVKSLVTPDEKDSDWVLLNSWIEPSKRQIYKSFSFIEERKKLTGWQSEPLRIPDRDRQTWESTHPLAQIEWTWDKNRATNTHYVNVVKAIKWWRRVNYLNVKYPKGYPLEHMIGNNCPDGVNSVAEGIVLSLENMVSNYQTYALLHQVPFLPDRGVPTHNVLARLSNKDFDAFYKSVCDAAKIARDAFDDADISSSVEKWKKLFGGNFPDSPKNTSTSNNGYTKREEVSQILPGRFA
jgi:hypothetical protein